MRSSIFLRLCFVSLCGLFCSAGCTPSSTASPPSPVPPHDPRLNPHPSADLATSQLRDASPSADLAMPADLSEVRTLDERFIGRWYIDQPYHALYEATFYEIHRDGTMQIGSNDYPAGCRASLYNPCVVGWVGTRDYSKACTFGSKWYSVDANTLVIRGECADGVQRYIRLGFPAAMGRDTHTEPEVLSVDGATGWLHNTFEWRFCKCPVGTTEATCHTPGGC